MGADRDRSRPPRAGEFGRSQTLWGGGENTDLVQTSRPTVTSLLRGPSVSARPVGAAGESPPPRPGPAALTAGWALSRRVVRGAGEHAGPHLTGWSGRWPWKKDGGKRGLLGALQDQYVTRRLQHRRRHSTTCTGVIGDGLSVDPPDGRVRGSLDAEHSPQLFHHL